ncbi:hypothetical protein WL76_27375 [Burkholderia ubonensis]|nr:hypothetical protein WL76_27375 [Burkholderia ubonensis]
MQRDELALDVNCVRIHRLAERFERPHLDHPTRPTRPIRRGPTCASRGRLPGLRRSRCAASMSRAAIVSVGRVMRTPVPSTPQYACHMGTSSPSRYARYSAK